LGSTARGEGPAKKGKRQSAKGKSEKPYAPKFLSKKQGIAGLQYLAAEPRRLIQVWPGAPLQGLAYNLILETQAVEGVK
jgi:hypothetical protein